MTKVSAFQRGVANTEVLDLIPFGKQLIETRDLDPVYVILEEGTRDWDNEKVYRWLLAYFCFYHMGTASWVSESLGSFWTRMKEAGASKNYPRCHERRHFRGENARKSIEYLSEVGVGELFKGIGFRNPPEFLRLPPIPLKKVMDHVQEWVGFGPWISFKVADMLERLGICPIEFDSGAMFLFDSPREGADLAWERYGAGEKPNHVGTWAVESILSHLGAWLAPPRYERRINSQEAETILCKWKSHCKGHYRIGEDIEACRSGLLWAARTRTGQELFTAGKKMELWR